MVEAARGPKLHPTSILEVHEVFEHIHILWLGLWIQPYCNACSDGDTLSQMTLWSLRLLHIMSRLGAQFQGRFGYLDTDKFCHLDTD
jgi:hypothetical protein